MAMADVVLCKPSSGPSPFYRPVLHFWCGAVIIFMVIISAENENPINMILEIEFTHLSDGPAQAQHWLFSCISTAAFYHVPSSSNHQQVHLLLFALKDLLSRTEMI